MLRKALPGTGVYQSPDGAFWARPTINKRRTWRRLAAVTPRKAIAEAARADWIARADTFANLAQYWLDAGCPGKTAKAAGQLTLHQEASKIRAENLVKFFGKFRADELRQKHIPAYAAWRRKQIKRNKSNGGASVPASRIRPSTLNSQLSTIPGGRTIDLDLATLSNILRFGVLQGHLEFNYLRSDRPRYAQNTRHAREVMPESAEIIHALAAEMFLTVRSEVHAWMAFFSEFTGCRTSELLRLRRDAKNKTEPGYIEWLEKEDCADDLLGHIYLGRRSKNGMNPWARIGPEFAEMLKAFHHWHRKRYHHKSPWYFPGRYKTEPLDPTSFGHSLTRILKLLSTNHHQPATTHITPHGFRAFYATKRLRDGARPVEIAAEMGDKTVALIETIYADNAAGKKLWWTPADGLPAWHQWLPVEKSAEVGRRSPSAPIRK